MPASLFTAAYEQLVASRVAMRKEAGLTQRQLAAKLGREQNYFARIETRRRRLDLVELIQLWTLFADRVYRRLHHGGALTDANAQARWLAVNNQICGAPPTSTAGWTSAITSPLTAAAPSAALAGSTATSINRRSRRGRRLHADGPGVSQPGAAGGISPALRRTVACVPADTCRRRRGIPASGRRQFPLDRPS